MGDNQARLLRCIHMAMGCLDPQSRNPDERLAWHRLSDAVNGREPRASMDNPETKNRRAALDELTAESERLGFYDKRAPDRETDNG